MGGSKKTWRWSVPPEAAPDKATYIEPTYRNGDPVAIDGQEMKPHDLLAKLNELGEPMVSAVWISSRTVMWE